MVDLRPLSLGEIIDRAATIWRTHWKALFKLFLGFQLATYVLMKGWELVAKTWFPISRGGARLMDSHSNGKSAAAVSTRVIFESIQRRTSGAASDAADGSMPP